MIKRSLCLIIILLITMNYNYVNASKSDIYKYMLETNQYTLIYRNETKIKDEESELKLFKEESYSDYLEKKKLETLTKGIPGSIIFISDGENLYKEMNYGHLSECQIKNGEFSYIFDKLLKKNGGVDYYGLNYDDKGGYLLKKNKIIPQRIIKNINYKKYFIDPTMDKLLSPILSENVKKSNLPKYKKVGEGSLTNSDTYEDYMYRDKNHWEIMRYYFQNNNFVKIVAASYDIATDGNPINYKKTIIIIDSFTNVIDNSKFLLPNDLNVYRG